MLLDGPCALCGATCRNALCAGCDGDLPRIGAACTACALPSAAARCGACSVEAPPWDGCVAPLLFTYPADRLLYAFKYHGRLSWARPLALEIVRRVRAAARPLPRVLVPVPVTPARLARRGYNQALELARVVGRELDIQVLAATVRRLRAESSQVGLDADARRRNVRGAFCMDHGTSIPDHVAIIDDLVTTGATAGAMAALLREHGSTRIEIWAVARTPPPGAAGAAG